MLIYILIYECLLTFLEDYFMEWWLKCIKNYVNFEGRARRKEYWMFYLFNVIFILILSIIDRLLKTEYTISELFELKRGIFESIYLLFIILPNLAVAVRRLHDVGKSGFFILINFIPIAGQIWFIALLCTEGQEFTNEYGPDPKAITEIDLSSINV